MFEDKTGHYVPQVTFRMWENGHWVFKNSDHFFRNKRVILFALPGAFTPVCSIMHLPSYNDLYDTFRENGIDDVYCLSVNDSFVMEAWKKAGKISKITMLPDAEGEFTKKMGFMLNTQEMCLGERSWRYSMIVNNCVIEKMFIEPAGQGTDPYGQSSAETMLKFLNPEARVPDSVAIFSSHGCVECEEVKELLKSRHLPFDELFLDDHFTIRTVKALSGSTYLPQIFVNGKRINLRELKDYIQAS